MAAITPRSGSIHVATTHRVYKDKTYETHLLRRSYREDGKVENETVGNISHLPVELIELLRRGLRGERVGVLDDVEIVASKAHGAVALVLGVARAVGLERALGPASAERDCVMATLTRNTQRAKDRPDVTWTQPPCRPRRSGAC